MSLFTTCDRCGNRRRLVAALGPDGERWCSACLAARRAQAAAYLLAAVAAVAVAGAAVGLLLEALR